MHLVTMDGNDEICVYFYQFTVTADPMMAGAVIDFLAVYVHGCPRSLSSDIEQ